MKFSRFLYCTILAASTISIMACANINTKEDYYYKEYYTVNDIPIEFYGKGYGSYGQLLPTYYSGTVESIFDPETEFSFLTSTHDNSSSSYNEVYITLTLNRHVNTVSTDFAIEDSTALSSFRISYKTPEDTEKDSEHSVTSSFKTSNTYKINADVTTMTLYIRQNKYFSSSHKNEQLRNQPAHNRFTIRKFIPE